MAKNFVQEGKVLTLNVGANVSSGDPVAVGEIVGVALTDADASGNAQIQTEGVFTLAVVGQSYDSVNAVYVDTAVNIGDAIYYDNGTLNKNDAGVLFGYALEAVAAGATATIKVKLAQK